MAVSISLWLVLACALIVSSALVWLNKHDASALASAAGTLAVCLAITAFQFMAFKSGPLSTRLFSLWSLWVLAPSAVVFAVSRLHFVRVRPWSLMLVGPVSFIIGLTLAMTVYNILFASGRSQ
jgi:hypothetical protein